MATNTAGTTARQLPIQAVHYLRRNISFADGASNIYTVGIIPAGALILKPTSGIFVSTVYNAGTNNNLIIGTTSGGNELLTATAMTSTVFTAVNTTTGVFRVSVDTTIYATHALTGTAATTGAGVVVIAFIPNNDL